MEFTLLGAAAVAVGSLYGMLWWEAGRGNAAECTRDLWDAALGAAIVGLAAGRLWSMAADGVNPITSPADILLVRGGVATGPAAAAALAALAWMGRRRFPGFLDALAPAVLAGLAGWHGGCLVRGTCLGTPSDLPWAWAEPGSAITRHPVEVYAAVLYLAAGVLLAVWKRRFPAPGVVAAAALAIAGLVRLTTEPLRPSLGGGPVVWYAAAAVAGVAAAGWAVARGRRDAARSASS
jgi:prolipoprotein diacylglyceryltransferase